MKIPNWRLAALLLASSSPSVRGGAAGIEGLCRPAAGFLAYHGGGLRVDHAARRRQRRDPASAKVPESRVGATRAGEGLTLSFKDAWYASLRVDGGKPVDLRPYSARGVLALDVNVKELSNGGISFALGCGDKCSRSVPYLVPARAIAGKGWRHLVFSMSCFVREGDDFSAVTQPFTLDASGSGEVSVANIRYQASGKPNASCPDYRTVSVTPDKLNESWSINWWTPRHEKKLAEAKALARARKWSSSAIRSPRAGKRAACRCGNAITSR